MKNVFITSGPVVDDLLDPSLQFADQLPTFMLRCKAVNGDDIAIQISAKS